MGLFSSIFGGSESKQQDSSKSGFALLPKELQKAFTQYGSQLSNLFQGGGPATTNPDLEAGYSRARQGIFNPQMFSSDIAMQMNPFDQYVVNDINREAMGQNSLVNQAATRAGQQGSNRQFLGTSDVEQNRLNSIGRFRQGQYNTAVQNALGPLAQFRQQDIGNLLNIGQQQQQQPFQNLLTYGQLLGAIPQSGGSTATGSSRSSNTNGVLGSLAGFFPG